MGIAAATPWKILTTRPPLQLLVLGEKVVLAASVLDGRGNLGTLQARLAQPGGSMFASFLGDDAYGQGRKRHCYSHCYFGLDG
jgi:hypothetical protein